MGLKDAYILVPVCPECGTISVKFTLWKGAFAVDADIGGKVRRLLRPGEVKTIKCTCNKCEHRWEEHVEGHDGEEWKYA